MQKNFVYIIIKNFLVIIILLLTSRPVFAGTATGTFTVSATVAASCTVTANNLAFGSYTLAQIDATSTVTVTCTNGTTYSIGLGPGSFTGATVSTRRMSGPSATGLSYFLYSDTGRTAVWGNTAGSMVTGTGSGAAQTLTVYGRIPADQAAQIGTYSDTITVTVGF